LLLISHGYAITTPTISQPLYAGMLALCFAYFVSTAADEYVHLSSLERPQSPGVTILTSSFLVVFNTIIICWIFCRTFTTMKDAQKENNEKYSMYRNLLSIFGVISIIAIIAFAAVIIVHFIGLEDDSYKWYWLLETYWDFIYYVVTGYMAYVWRPTDNNQRYAYVTIIDTDKSDVELSIRDEEINESEEVVEIENNDNQNENNEEL